VQTSREELGRQLAREAPVEADLVVPVPDSGVTAAVGYAAESGIPFRFGLIRNHYVGRTFIEPSQSVRDFGVKLKLNPVQSLLEGKRVVLIDDSIVRGTTSRKIVRMIRSAGAKEVHMRISCPPTISPCYYGVDTPSKNQLIAANNPSRKFANTSASIRSLTSRWKDSRKLAAMARKLRIAPLLYRQISYEHCGRGRHPSGADTCVDRSDLPEAHCKQMGDGVSQHDCLDSITRVHHT